MKRGSLILHIGALLIFLIIPSVEASAKTQGYCLECHSKEKIQVLSLREYRSIYHAKLDPCPGLRFLSEEIFFTESRIVQLDEILDRFPGEGRTAGVLKKEVSKTGRLFFDRKGDDIFSAARFSQQGSNSRASLQKVYDQTLQIREDLDHQGLIGVAGLIFLGLLALIVVGYRKLNQMGKMIFLIFLIGSPFVLASCSIGPVEPKKKSPAMERLEQALSVATQSTTRMEDLFYHSILLSEIARDWSKIEPGAAEKAFELAWETALKAREETKQVRTLQEIVSQYPDETTASAKKINFDTVLDLKDEIENGNDRTWALRAIAEEWIKVNEKKGRKALQFASQQALAIETEAIRDRELKPIAEGWAAIDPVTALKIGRSIRDPFLKSVTLTHIAEKNKAKDLLEEAWGMAQCLPPSFPQAKALIRISATAARIFPQEKKAWGKRVFEQVKNLKSTQLQALASQEMVSQWIPLDQEQAEHWKNEMLSHFPEASTYSLIELSTHPKVSKEKSLSSLRKGLLEATKMTDPFEAKKIKSLIVKRVAEREPEEALRMIPQIEDPFYRSEILLQLGKQVSIQDKKRGLDLVSKIPLEPFRMKAMVEIIESWMAHEKERISKIYQKTLRIIPSVSDPYKRAFFFIQMGKDWERLEQGKNLILFDMAFKSALTISSPSLRAEVIESLAEGLKNLDKKKAQSLLNEIDPSVTRTRRLLEEIRLWSKIDPRKALAWTETIPHAFPLEKAMAYRDVAITLKQGEPSLAFDLLEKALTLSLASEEGPRRNRLLPSLVREMVSQSREKSLQRLLQVEEPPTRDYLLREAGNGLIQEDPLWSARYIREISESSLRLPLYQRIADQEGKKTSSKKPPLLLFQHWGRGRLKAKTNELQAIPHYEKAFQEIEKVIDPEDRSYLLSGLATDWAQINEEKALKIVESIPTGHPEPHSYGLLQTGSRLGKWNRREALSVYQRAISSATQIQNPLLLAKRLLQIAQEWQTIDPEKGKSLLKMAEGEARKSPFRNGVEEILYEIFLLKISLDPTEVFTIAQQGGSPYLQMRILLEGTRRLTKTTIDENAKLLETALQFGQISKNPNLLTQIGVTWSSLDMKKGLDIIRQADSREIRLNALRLIAKKINNKKEKESLLKQALEEALGMDDLSEKLKGLKEIATDWVSINKEKSKALYRMAYRLMKEKVTFNYGLVTP